MVAAMVGVCVVDASHIMRNQDAESDGISQVEHSLTRPLVTLFHQSVPTSGRLYSFPKCTISGGTKCSTYEPIGAAFWIKP